MSPKSSIYDAKNATARHSEIFSDEDYETQYLSQVSRHGFFGKKGSSTRHLEINGQNHSSMQDDALFDRDRDSLSD